MKARNTIRSEQEMLDLLCHTGMKDNRIRAAYMNGSRVNPNIPGDEYQDYDVVYVVTETESFLSHPQWISVFGELAMVQEPDSNDFGWGVDADFSRSYCWLMLFLDGNRIDLHIITKEAMREEYGQDSLTRPLFDKDAILPPIDQPNDSSYWIRKPSLQQYLGCCNEFWWCLNNVVKGIARDQLPYAMRMYYSVVHAELDRMLEWYIGTETKFTVSAGMWGKYMKQYLPEEFYLQYERTFSDGSYGNLWNSVLSSCSLFHLSALKVGEDLGYPYRESDEQNMLSYLKKTIANCRVL